MSAATALFPLWALLGSALAYVQPHWLTPLKPAIVPLLGLVMFGMGVTLTWRQFAAVLRRPQRVGLGMALQFGIMPLAAWIIAQGLGLPAELVAGMVLVGASPGGTASNVICFLARGDVALSITLTAASTLLAVLATPLLTWLYVGREVAVPVWDMLLSVAKIVLLPVALGVVLNTWLGARLAPVKHLFPLLSMAAIVLIIAIIVALNVSNIAAAGWLIALAVVLHNAVGLGAGYGLGWLATRDLRVARTLGIEVGMQNSGLAVALAVQYFSAAAAIPGALFSIWHNLSGSALAALWSRQAGMPAAASPEVP
ncbi:MAG: bile acid:sodium symporter family protein [Thiohalocapsa sp.]|jgi:BASS family bile acid:Na+ symporter|uniref:bile acid:sodium symporter family protein n=1 Tax=Thiohalocapsa sp. TaxID=2497641 RepID=UPI0025F9063B|nr:bile acid:sodium symporter family protein [Thiohalocapsa sp.]MCG6940272.1 bile acid:sodium symporter family protein [Thiohalocapsa sp.]